MCLLRTMCQGSIFVESSRTKSTQNLLGKRLKEMSDEILLFSKRLKGMSGKRHPSP